MSGILNSIFGKIQQLDKQIESNKTDADTFIRALNTTFEEINKSLDLLKTKSNNISDITNKLQRAQADIVQLNTIVKARDDEIDKLSAGNDDLKTELTKEKEDAQDKMKGLQDEIDKLNAELDKEIQKISGLATTTLLKDSYTKLQGIQQEIKNMTEPNIQKGGRRRRKGHKGGYLSNTKKNIYSSKSKHSRKYKHSRRYKR